MKRGVGLIAFSVSAVVAVAVSWTVPVWWCGRNAPEWYRGDAGIQMSLARTVIAQCSGELGTDDFHTGSSLYSGEWLFGTYMMSGIGLCQIAAAHPELLGECAPAIENCIDGILSDAVSEFDAGAWDGERALASLEGGQGHAAYLGYLNFLLGKYREVAPQNRFVALNDRISRALVERVSESPNGLMETYPGEWYSVDNSPVFASIAQHAQITGQETDRARELLRSFERRCVDPETGLLFQAIDVQGDPIDRPRGSGTALGIFFLGQVDPELGRRLYTACTRELSSGLLGFGAMREYPHGINGPEDIDSGPIILGFGFSATGFSIAGARMFGDAVEYRRLYASAHLAGAPVRHGDRLQFLSGGPLGNAILLAVLTSPPVSVR